MSCNQVDGGRDGVPINSLRSLLRRTFGRAGRDCCGRPSGRFGIEAVAREQGVRPLAPESQVQDPLEGSSVAREQALGSNLVDAGLPGLHVGRIPPRFERPGDNVLIEALASELEPERALAAGARAVA